MRRFISICGFLALALALVACDPPLTKGYVLEKHDIPAHTTPTPTRISSPMHG